MAATAAGNDEIHSIHVPLFSLPRESLEEDDDDGEEDARSDSDSTVMMSGNSPFVSKSARYNFLQRSGNIFPSFMPPKYPMQAHVFQQNHAICDVHVQGSDILVCIK